MDMSAHEITVETSSAGERLPERLHAAGAPLFAFDCGAAICTLVPCALLGVGASGFLTLAATILIARACGRYHRSFAAAPYEEWYQAAGVALAGVLSGIVLSVSLGLSLLGVILAAVIWTAIAGFGSSMMTRSRRNGLQYDVTIERVTERPLSLGGHIEHAIIRALDAVLAAIAIVVLLPLLALVALIILIRDGAPVIFAQRRVGRDDRDFIMYKYRTMRSDSGEEWVTPGDARITPTGAFLRRTSIDELPQLLNVLIGDMSLVGPRPEMRDYAEAFAHKYTHYSQRHILRPGLTGWAQIRMRRNFQPSDEPELLRHDLFYIQNAGVYLYLFCLVKTAVEVIRHRAV